MRKSFELRKEHYFQKKQVKKQTHQLDESSSTVLRLMRWASSEEE